MIQRSIDSMVDEPLDGKTWTVDEFHKNCCANKSAEWHNFKQYLLFKSRKRLEIGVFIFYKF